RPGSAGHDRVDRKAIAVHHRFVAPAEIALGQKVQQIVRAIAADDLGGVNAVNFAERLAQEARSAIRIDLEIGTDAGIGLDGAGTGAQRALIGRELDGLRTRRGRFARDIGGNIEDAGLRLGMVWKGHVWFAQGRRKPGGPYAMLASNAKA